MYSRITWELKVLKILALATSPIEYFYWSDETDIEKLHQGKTYIYIAN